MRASETDRAVACPHSLVVPRDLLRRTSSEAASGYGRLVHAWKEAGGAYVGAMWSQRDVDLLERKILASGAGLSWHPRDFWDGGRHEVTFALDLLRDPPEVLWYDGPRDGADDWKSSFGWEWLTGTMDYLLEGPRDLVDDLKTTNAQYELLAADSGQLRSYALPVWAGKGCPADYLIDVTITNWPKYPLASPPWRSRATLDAMDLEEHLAALRAAVRTPERASPGDVCTWCDGRLPTPASPWMQSWKYRAMPTCEKGLTTLLRKCDTSR